MKRRIKNILIILLSSVLLGTILLTLIFCLPVESARENVKESLYQMIEVKDDPAGDADRKYILSIKENFTDALMVQNALERVEGESMLAHAMYVYHYDLNDETYTTWQTENSLITFLREGEDGLYLREYSKYWHGYLVYLKPLLMCMSWETLEIFLAAVQILLMIAVVAVAFWKKQPLLGTGLVVALLYMKPVRIWISLAMSVCWTIVLVAALLLILKYDRIQEKNWKEEFFLIIGIITAYLDFLTYPVVTLGVPLCIYLVRNQEEVMSLWSRVKQAFWICVCWAVGYAGMWGAKWIVAEVTCQTGTLRNAVWSVITRAEPLDGYGSFMSGMTRTLRTLLGQYDSALYTVGLVVLVAATLVAVVLCLVKARNTNWAATVAALCVVAIFPVGWLVATQNHTAIHCWFTFRILGVSIMALWCILVCSLRNLKRKAGENGA